MKKRVFTRAPQDPERLDALLSVRLGIPRDQAEELIARGAVHVDGVRVTDNEQIAVGAKLVAFLDAKPAEPEPPLVIAYEDAWLAVADKPAGMPVQAERSASEQALDARMQRRLKGVAKLMHRLDKEASGLVLFARRKEATVALQHALDAGLVDRRYVAIVAGELAGDGTIRLRIGRHASDVRKRAAFAEHASEGQPACSRYRVLARHGKLTAVELTLETGRTHQLRVHMSAMGHPLVGDEAYGGPHHARLCLHAHALAFPHPHTQERIEVSSKLPAEFAKLVPGLTRPFA